MLYIVEAGKVGEGISVSMTFKTMKEAVKLCEQLTILVYGDCLTNYSLKKNEPRKCLSSSTHVISIRKYNGVFPHN